MMAMLWIRDRVFVSLNLTGTFSFNYFPVLLIELDVCPQHLCFLAINCCLIFGPGSISGQDLRFTDEYQKLVRSTESKVNNVKWFSKSCFV